MSEAWSSEPISDESDLYTTFYRRQQQIRRYRVTRPGSIARNHRHAVGVKCSHRIASEVMLIYMYRLVAAPVDK